MALGACVGGASSGTTKDMDRNTIIRLSDHPGARRRGVVLKSVKVRLPALVAARLAAAAKRHGVSQTDIIVAGLAVACPGEGTE